MSIVEVRGLCKAFGDNQVLKNLDFQIEKGEVVTLIGQKAEAVRQRFFDLSTG